ncbi:MAG: hypothetical protein ACTSWR_06635 [Candidatus Helarchaeota archaeon]
MGPGYKKDLVLLGDTLTYQTKINNPLSNEESEDIESAPFKHEYIYIFVSYRIINNTHYICHYIWYLGANIRHK